MWDGFARKKSLLSKKDLMNSNTFDLLRLASFLGLKRNLDSMSKRQLVCLIYWRLTR